MNISGWIMTLILLALTIYRVMVFDHTKCQYGIELPPFNSDIHRCSNGMRYHKETLADLPETVLGPCFFSPMQHVYTFSRHMTDAHCTSYLFEIISVFLIFILPFLVDTQTRILFHTCLNAIALQEGKIVTNNLLSTGVLLVVVAGIFIFRWNLNNGDGMWGPFIRTRARGQNVRFVN